MSSFDDWYGILTTYYDDWDDDDEDKIDWDDDEYNDSEEDDWKEIQFLIDRIIKRRQLAGNYHSSVRR